jgi:hypothetical protein
MICTTLITPAVKNPLIISTSAIMILEYELEVNLDKLNSELSTVLDKPKV